MSKWRLTSLVDLASQAVVAARYVVVLALLSAAVVYGSDRLLQSTLHSFDPVVMSLPIDDAVVHNHRVQSTANARAGEARESTEDVVFDHARPSPRLFERVSAVEAEKIKASVRETVVAEGAEDWYHGSGGTYRTVCVRLCDGAYFPVSFSTTRNWFNRDEAVCKSRCGAPARLYVAPNPGGSPETMRDRNGASYIALPTAFQFRKGTVSGCSCRAEAWEAASIERHRGYEIAAASAAAPVAASDSVRVADGVAPNVTQNVAHDASEGRLRVAVAGWTSTGDATTGSLVVDEVAAEAAQIPPVEPTPAGGREGAAVGSSRQTGQTRRRSAGIAGCRAISPSDDDGSACNGCGDTRYPNTGHGAATPGAGRAGAQGRAAAGRRQGAAGKDGETLGWWQAPSGAAAGRGRHRNREYRGTVGDGHASAQKGRADLGGRSEFTLCAAWQHGVRSLCAQLLLKLEAPPWRQPG